MSLHNPSIAMPRPAPRVFQPLADLEPSYRARFIRGSIHVQNVNAPDIPYEEDPTFIPLTKFHKRYRVPELTATLKWFDDANTPAFIRAAFIASSISRFHDTLMSCLNKTLCEQVEDLPVWLLDNIKVVPPGILDAHAEVKKQLDRAARQCAMAIKDHPSGKTL